MNIGIGKSTYALMVADPLAILEENEIHLGFSNIFRDPKDGLGQVLLHEMDVLVARLPALLSSDIQKAGLRELIESVTFSFLAVSCYHCFVPFLPWFIADDLFKLSLTIRRYARFLDLSFRFTEMLSFFRQREIAPWPRSYLGK